MPNEMLNRVLAAKPEEYPALLREGTDCAAMQEQTLLDILERAKHSDYGKKYGFEAIHSAEEFRRAVPVTEFGDYAPYIERMMAGEADVLFDGKTSYFCGTSGTTGKAKFIPDSALGARIKQAVTAMRAAEIGRYCPEVYAPDAKVMAISNLAVLGKSAGGIPLGTASGQAAGDSEEWQSQMAVPTSVLNTAGLSVEQLNYLTALFGFSERNVRSFGMNNLAHAEILRKQFNDEFDRFARDIREGTISLELSDELRKKLSPHWKPDPARAAELEAARAERGELTYGDFWKGLRVVNCWLSSSVGRVARELRSNFPKETMFYDWGYGASEGKFNVATEMDCSDGRIAAFGYFFEFLPLGGGEPLMLKDAADGRQYELLLTNYSGFYRYNIHDIVELGSLPDGARTIKFVDRATDRIEMNGRFLYASEVTAFVEEWERATGERIRLFQATRDGDGLRMIAECANPNVDRQDFERHMAARFKERGIELTGVDWKPKGYRETLFAVSNGKKSGNVTKLLVFV